ncbi:hypothetical protein AAF143_15840 [Cyanobium sp. ATX-6F1]
MEPAAAVGPIVRAGGFLAEAVPATEHLPQLRLAFQPLRLGRQPLPEAEVIAIEEGHERGRCRLPAGVARRRNTAGSLHPQQAQRGLLAQLLPTAPQHLGRAVAGAVIHGHKLVTHPR